jgi:hypothetical protein
VGSGLPEELVSSQVQYVDGFQKSIFHLASLFLAKG